MSADKYKSESGAIGLLDINEDIICFHLIRYLDENDIRALFLTCRSLYLTLNQAVVWHTMFKKAFNSDNIPFDIYYKWPQLYKLRRNCKLLTFGNNGFSRLGWNEVSRETHFELINPMRGWRLVKPVELSFPGQKLYDISAGGFSFCVLTSDGDLYYTGRNWQGMMGFCEPGPSARDYHFEVGGYSNQNQEGQCVAKVDVEGGVKFIQVGSGRSHFIALDENNQIWSWDSMGQHQRGIKLNLVDSSGKSVVTENDYVIKIRAGWGMSSCQIRNVGIVVWKRRERLEMKDGRYGPVNAWVTVLEHTKDQDVLDFIALDNFLIYLTGDGQLYKVDLSGVDLSERYSIPKGHQLKRFQSYANEHSRQSLQKPKFIRLSGSFSRFCAITNDDQVLIGDKNSNDPIILRELQHNSIISVVVGDYHFLALNKKGEMYSWGRESHKSGCLGLGTLENALSTSSARLDGADLVVERPTKLPIKGQVLAIAAAGWQSAALIHQDSGQ